MVNRADWHCHLESILETNMAVVKVCGDANVLSGPLDRPQTLLEFGTDALAMSRCWSPSECFINGKLAPFTSLHWFVFGGFSTFNDALHCYVMLCWHNHFPVPNRSTTITHCSSYLNSILRQIRLEWEHFAGIHIRIMSIFESLLQFFQLITSEYCPV